MGDGALFRTDTGEVWTSPTSRTVSLAYLRTNVASNVASVLTLAGNKSVELSVVSTVFKGNFTPFKGFGVSVTRVGPTTLSWSPLTASLYLPSTIISLVYS